MTHKFKGFDEIGFKWEKICNEVKDILISGGMLESDAEYAAIAATSSCKKEEQGDYIHNSSLSDEDKDELWDELSRINFPLIDWMTGNSNITAENQREDIKKRREYYITCADKLIVTLYPKD